MAYKRTSKKFGNIRTTKTINTNGNITNSSSTGTTGNRVTTSWSSKGGMKQTRTYTDGAGFVHKQTIYKSPTAAQKAKESKKAAEFWSGVFGTKKKKGAEGNPIHTLFGWVAAIIIVLMIYNMK
jgi:hypothetical protein